MCWPGQFGGPCCAAIARPTFFTANPALPDYDHAAATYAATAEGHEHLSRCLRAAETRADFPEVDRLTKALRVGTQTLHTARTERARALLADDAFCEDHRPAAVA